MTFKKISSVFLAAALLVFAGIAPALADTYPSKPITLIIPLGAGGSHDLNARVFTSVIPTYLNQAMVVKLMPGAGGQTGTAAAIKAKADGYTLIFTHNYIDQLQPLIEKLPYDPFKSLKAVCRLNYAPSSLVVRADKPWKTLPELLDYGKKNPGKMIFTTSGNWGATMVPGARVLSQAGVEATYIPYKGGGPAMQALLAGDGDFMMSFPSQAMPLVEAGKIRALASAGEKRTWKDVPTLKELGYEVGTMDRAVLAPAGVPEDRMKILMDAFQKLNSDKTYQNLMKKIGENMEYMPGPEYEKVRRDQQEKYKILVKKLTGN
ncbi:MAG: tripartite tricarboxylate transporter substrate binding protein [Pseudomonadota bacterium]